jgi:penicillin-binding protein 1A
VINDAPLIFDAEQTGNEPWEPKNYDGKFEGPMRMRQGLIKSKNLVSIRILQSITPEYAHDYITRFGFDPARYPAYLTMALGAGSVTPMQMLTGYSVFANGGFLVTPYFIDRIEDARGTVLSKTVPEVAGNGAKQVIDVRNAYTMVSMLQDVVKHGTGIRAMQLGRQRGWATINLAAWATGKPEEARPCRYGWVTWKRCSKMFPRLYIPCRTTWSPCTSMMRDIEMTTVLW